MKRASYKIFLLLVLLIIGSRGISADNTESVSISLYTEETDSESGDLLELDPKGPRIPAAPLFCTITKTEGVQITGVDNSEIEGFEIRDIYGNTIAVLSDESSFVDTLFTLKGEYRILFRLSNRSLAGWIQI